MKEPDRKAQDQTDETVSDEDLVLASQDGSLGAFSKLVQRHQSRLYAFLLQKTGNQQDAEDLVQTTFVVAHKRLSHYQSKGKFSAWLFTIAHRQAISHFRTFFRRKRLYQLIESEKEQDAFDPAHFAESRDLSRSLWRTARTMLSEAQHTAIWLHYAEGMSMEEIGLALGKRPGSVKVILHRARKTLAEHLNREEKMPERTRPLPAPKGGVCSKSQHRHPLQSKVPL